MPEPMELAHDTPSYHQREILPLFQLPVQVVVIIFLKKIQWSYNIKAPVNYQVSRQHDCY